MSSCRLYLHFSLLFLAAFTVSVIAAPTEDLLESLGKPLDNNDVLESLVRYDLAEGDSNGDRRKRAARGHDGKVPSWNGKDGYLSGGLSGQRPTDYIPRGRGGMASAWNGKDGYLLGGRGGEVPPPFTPRGRSGKRRPSFNPRGRSLRKNRQQRRN